jgi:hypothetical protein
LERSHSIKRIGLNNSHFFKDEGGVMLTKIGSESDLNIKAL